MCANDDRGVNWMFMLGIEQCQWHVLLSKRKQDDVVAVRQNIIVDLLEVSDVLPFTHHMCFKFQLNCNCLLFHYDWRIVKLGLVEIVNWSDKI